MNEAQLEQIVQAVLYEGYLLYPYRASAKNHPRQRFTFGRVYPQAYSAAQKGAEPFVMQTECLVSPSGDDCAVTVTVRFLHPMAREVARLSEPFTNWTDGTTPDFEVVPELEIGGQRYQTWLEAVERRVSIPTVTLGSLHDDALKFPFEFSASRLVEPIRDEQGQIPAVLVRRQDALKGVVELRATTAENGLRRVTARILNLTPTNELDLKAPETILMRTFASAHTILTVQGGEFISLLDPASEHQPAAKACENIGTWPVLVGDEEKRERDTLLSSPIILYDYPRIAPESAGSLFDGTEIDEILSLRILTLTEQEKLDARAVDEHARRLLERTELLPKEALLKMHGMMRAEKPELPVPLQAKTTDSRASRSPSPQPSPQGEGAQSAPAVEFDDFFGASRLLKGIWYGGVHYQPGGRVRLRPKARADAIDLTLADQVAIIEAVEQDLEGKVYLAVVIENDPGKDLGFMRQPGHRFFYGVDEVEPLSAEVEAP